MSNSKLPTITVADIRGWGPCYDPTEYVAEDWHGTALDVLRIDKCPAEDRLWVVLREKCISTKILFLFAIWCTRRTLVWLGNIDLLSVNFCDIAEKFVNGGATLEELNIVREAVKTVSWFVINSTLKKASEIARRASRTAAGLASQAASGASFCAPRDIAWEKEREAQAKHLIEMLEGVYEQA